MPTIQVQVRRLSVVSSKPLEEIVKRLAATIGRPDMNEFHSGERQRMKKHRTRPGSSGELHEFGLAAAARAIRNGEVSPEIYVGKLLERARAHADLKAFITIDEASVLQAAGQADRSLRAGGSAPLLGVPLAVKDEIYGRDRDRPLFLWPAAAHNHIYAALARASA
jgi:hypothetical protein